MGKVDRTGQDSNSITFTLEPNAFICLIVRPIWMPSQHPVSRLDSLQMVHTLIFAISQLSATVVDLHLIRLFIS